MATKITSHVIADNAVTDAKLHSDFTATTQSASDNTTNVATTAYVTTAIANLADSAPSTLNTLNELAAALNDDASFSTTVTNSIATKLPLAGGSLTGDLTIAFDSNNAGNRLRIADTEGSSAAVRTYSTSDGTGLILNHYYAVAGSPYLRYSDFVSSMADGAATKMRFLTKPQNANPAVALTIDQSQNVGIGTTTPSKNLHISGTGSELLVEGTNNSISSLIAGVSVKAHHYRKAGLTIYDESDNEDFFIGRPYGAANYFDIINDGTLRFRINVFGNVGIGTSSPSNKLHVTGSAISGASADANSMLYLENNANNSIQINSSSSLNGQIRFGDADSNYRGAITYNHSTDSLTFTSAGSDRMLINSSGDISMNRRLYLAGAGQEFIQSAGSLRIDIDHDNNQTDRIFVVSKHNAATELMRVQEDGNVGIGTTSPDGIIHVKGTANRTCIIERTSGSEAVNLAEMLTHQALTIQNKASGGFLNFAGDASASVIQSQSNSSTAEDIILNPYGGRVGIGTTSVGAKLYVSGKDDAGASDLLALQFDNSPADTGITFRDIFDGTQSRFTIDSSNTNDLRISSGTQIHLYGGTSNGTGDGHLKINSSGHFTSTYGMIVSVATFAEVSNVGFGSYNSGAWVNGKSASASWLAVAGNGVLKWQTGSVFVNGSLSKNSGSFKIPHPLPSKKSTHALVHSFIEGPQADNIYRGVVDLVNGTATINIDTVSGMTEGTYVLLNTNTSCFTSNETDWDAVKGSVSGNILTITCQNSSSTATVSWLVIGERHDQHMKDTDWTDSDGKVIVEPLKEQEVNLGD